MWFKTFSWSYHLRVELGQWAQEVWRSDTYTSKELLRTLYLKQIWEWCHHTYLLWYDYIMITYYLIMISWVEVTYTHNKCTSGIPSLHDYGSETSSRPTRPALSDSVLQHSSHKTPSTDKILVSCPVFSVQCPVYYYVLEIFFHKFLVFFHYSQDIIIIRHITNKHIVL